MGLFSFTQEIAMDLGTANTIITTNGKIVVDEPSVVALDRRTDKMIAVGEKAKLMHEKTHENIRTIRPLRDGVIADFYACEQMIRGLIKMVNNRNRHGNRIGSKRTCIVGIRFVAVLVGSEARHAEDVFGSFRRTSESLPER